MFLKILFISFFIPLINIFTGWFVDYLNNLLKQANKAHEEFEERLKIQRTDEVKRIRRIFGNIEIFIFFLSTIFLLYFQLSAVEVSRSLLLIASGWMAIKIVGNFQQWADPKIGRITYNIFILGSIINIVGGVVVALVAFFLIK